MTDVEWAVVRDAMPVPAWPEGRGGQPEGYCHRQLVDAVRYLVAGLTKLASIKRLLAAGRLRALTPSSPWKTIMIKRAVVGVTAAALFSLGTGVALANAGVDSAARPAGDGTYVPVAEPTQDRSEHQVQEFPFWLHHANVDSASDAAPADWWHAHVNAEGWSGKRFDE
ncbi:hypothetical protein ACFZB9_22245 [Kitasatospora sp. NPDC008050]|uniref:hypothetical protein n=1 Tax=Kitasatospora sp. NPDC008050 TaxID=3364021 RepID=UPI0036EA1E84